MSPFGVRGLAGNVREWTASHHRDDYTSQNAAEVAYTVRGGGWQQTDGFAVATTRRSATFQRDCHPMLGFRCAADADGR